MLPVSRKTLGAVHLHHRSRTAAIAAAAAIAGSITTACLLTGNTPYGLYCKGRRWWARMQQQVGTVLASSWARHQGGLCSSWLCPSIQYRPRTQPHSQHQDMHAGPKRSPPAKCTVLVLVNRCTCSNPSRGQKHFATHACMSCSLWLPHQVLHVVDSFLCHCHTLLNFVFLQGARV
jgi:hypothetical protein